MKYFYRIYSSVIFMVYWPLNYIYTAHIAHIVYNTKTLSGYSCLNYGHLRILNNRQKAFANIYYNHHMHSKIVLIVSLNIREHTHTHYFILTVNILIHRYLIRINCYITICLEKCISLITLINNYNFVYKSSINNVYSECKYLNFRYFKI